MKLRLVLTVAALAAVATPHLEAQGILPDSVIAAAIAEGSQYKSRSAYLDDGTRDVTCTLSSIWSLDGITKEVRFFGDYEAIAAAAAEAHSQMRPFGVAEAKSLPLTGLLHVNVQMTAHGAYPVKTLLKRYAAGGVHTVLQIRDSLVQPLDFTAAKSNTDTEISGVLIHWYRLGNTSLITGTPLGPQSSHFEQEFTFPVPTLSLPRKVKVFVIDSDGGKSDKECAVSAVAHH